MALGPKRKLIPSYGQMWLVDIAEKTFIDPKLQHVHVGCVKVRIPERFESHGYISGHRLVGRENELDLIMSKLLLRMDDLVVHELRGRYKDAGWFELLWTSGDRCITLYPTKAVYEYERNYQD